MLSAARANAATGSRKWARRVGTNSASARKSCKTGGPTTQTNTKGSSALQSRTSVQTRGSSAPAAIAQHQPRVGPPPPPPEAFRHCEVRRTTGSSARASSEQEEEKYPEEKCQAKATPARAVRIVPKPRKASSKKRCRPSSKRRKRARKAREKAARLAERAESTASKISSMHPLTLALSEATTQSASMRRGLDSQATVPLHVTLADACAAKELERLDGIFNVGRGEDKIKVVLKQEKADEDLNAPIEVAVSPAPVQPQAQPQQPAGPTTGSNWGGYWPVPYCARIKLTEEKLAYARFILPNVENGFRPHDHGLSAVVRGHVHYMTECLAASYAAKFEDEVTIADFNGCARLDNPKKHVFMPVKTPRDLHKRHPDLASRCECEHGCPHSGPRSVGIGIDTLYYKDWEKIIAECKSVNTKTVFYAYHKMEAGSGSELLGEYQWTTNGDQAEVICGTGSLREKYTHRHPHWFNRWVGKQKAVGSDKRLSIAHRRSIGPMCIVAVTLEDKPCCESHAALVARRETYDVVINPIYNYNHGHDLPHVKDAGVPLCNSKQALAIERAVINAARHAGTILRTSTLRPGECPHGVVASESFPRFMDKAMTKPVVCSVAAPTIEEGKGADYLLVKVVHSTDELMPFFHRECIFFNHDVAVFGPRTAQLRVEREDRLVLKFNGPLVEFTGKERRTHLGILTVRKSFSRILSSDVLKRMQVDSLRQTKAAKEGEVMRKLVASVICEAKKTSVRTDLVTAHGELYARAGFIRASNEAMKTHCATEEYLPEVGLFENLRIVTHKKSLWHRLRLAWNDCRAVGFGFSWRRWRGTAVPTFVTYGDEAQPFIHLDGVCAKDVPLCELAPGASVEIVETGPPCELLIPNAATAYGPLISPLLCQTPCGCIHDIMCALCNRQARHPNMPVNAAAFKRTRDFIWRDEIFQALFGASNRRPIEPMEFRKWIETSKWNNSLKESRAEAIYDWITCCDEEMREVKGITQIGAFIKREVSIKTPEMLKMKPFNPRCISSFKDAYQSALGPYTKSFANHLKTVWTPTTASGTPSLFVYGMVKPEKIAKTFKAWDCYSSFAEADYSKFDAHQMTELINFEIDVYKRCFGEYFSEKAEALFRTQLIGRGNILGTQRDGYAARAKYEYVGKRESGGPATSVGNSVNNSFCLIGVLLDTFGERQVSDWLLGDSPVHFLIGGDDVAVAGDAEIMAALAANKDSANKFGMRLDWIPRDTLRDTTFFQRNYYPTVEDGMVGIPKVGRLLAKTFVTTKPVANVERADEAINTLSKNFATQFRGFPVIHKLFSRLAAITEKTQSKRMRRNIILDQYQKEVALGLKADAVRCAPLPSKEAVDTFLDHYGLTEKDVKTLENDIKRITSPRVLLDHPLWHKFLVADEVIPADQVPVDRFGAGHYA